MDGNVDVIRGSFFSNQSINIDPAGGLVGSGGAIFSSPFSISAFNIISSTFDHNWAPFGGALYAGGYVSIINSTFAYNTAHNGGGAIVLAGPQSSIEYSTIVANSSDISPQVGGSNVSGGGGIFVLNHPETILSKNIVANNNGLMGVDVMGQFVSHGYNLIKNRSGSAGYIDTDLPEGIDPKLGALKMNQPGKVKTMMPLPGSLVVDAVPASVGGSGCDTTNTDAFGLIRLRSNEVGCDIGAVEGTDVDTIFSSDFGG